MNKKGKRVALGLSGGVDSAVAAVLLKKAGYNVTCIFLKVYEPDDAYTDECTWKEDMESAQQVAHVLGLPFESWNFEREYEQTVLDYFFKELQKGRTPNPDTLCNRDIKFGAFYKKAKEKGFDYIATGHYAQITRVSESLFITRGLDPEKISLIFFLV